MKFSSTYTGGEYQPGSSVEYTSCTTDVLLGLALRGDSAMVRRLAGAGVMRALLDTYPGEREAEYHMDAADLVSDIIQGSDMSTGYGQAANPDVMDYIFRLAPASGVLDTTTMAATLANNPAQMVKSIDEVVRSDKPKLVIGLGHGGILSSLATFAALGQGDHAFYPVRYSRDKLDDDEPVLADFEMEKITALAQERTTIVHDEDTASGRTILGAAQYFSKGLRTKVYGAVPVHADAQNVMSPYFVKVGK